jgi:hypothetical protein
MGWVSEKPSSLRRAWRAWRAAATTPVEQQFGEDTPAAFARPFIVLIPVIVIVFALAIPVRYAVVHFGFDERSPWEMADGTVELSDGAITARYTKAGGESAFVSERDGTGFTATEWILKHRTKWVPDPAFHFDTSPAKEEAKLIDGDEIVSVTDYRFEFSPVKDELTRKAYLLATERAFKVPAGHLVKSRPITVDGRQGRVSTARADGGGWALQADFPGDPSTVRVRCVAQSIEAEIAQQCKEVLRSLRFGD